MKKQAFSKLARKSVATLAAGALALSLFSCAKVEPRPDDGRPHFAAEVQQVDDDATPMANETFLTIQAGAATPVSPGSNTYYFPNLVVDTNSPRPLHSITIQFTSPVGTDSITLNSNGKFVKFKDSKKTNASVNVDGGATPEEWQEYLRDKDNMTITLDGATTKSLRMIANFEPVTAVYDYNALNGHYYKTVKQGVGWETAFAAATAPTEKYMGMQGYLVTVTSQAEHDYVYTMIGTDCWMGLTSLDAYTSKVRNKYADYYSANNLTIPAQTYTGSNACYMWVCGPEAGMVESNGGYQAQSAWKNPTTGETFFMNWGSGEPNNASGEQCAHLYSTTGGKWNDFDKGRICQYVIEYGGLEADEDNSGTKTGVDMDIYVKVDINIDPSGQTLTTEAYPSTVGEKLDIRENVNGDPNVTLHNPDGTVQIDEETGEPETTPVTRTFYVKDDTADGGWRALQEGDRLLDPETGMPAHAGIYKVESNALWGKDREGKDVQYKVGSATFTIKPKQVLPVVEKTYDGTNIYSVDALDISAQTLPGAQVTASSDKAVVFNDFSVDGAEEAYLTNMTLSGVDADDYVLPDTDEEGRFVTVGKIVPREIEVSAIATVNWGLAGKELKDGSGNLIDYKNNLAIHKDGEWAKNELAERDAIDGDVTKTILGDVAYTALAGTTELNKTAPTVGRYDVIAHFANVNPAGASAADAGKNVATLSMMAEEDEETEGEGEGEEAEETAPTKQYGVIKQNADGLDEVKGEPMGGNRYNLGNYILTLKDAGVVVTDNPLNEDGYEDATKFLSDTYNDKVDPEAKPLTQQQLIDLVKELFGDDLPEGTPNIMITDKDGNIVDTIDPTKVGSYAIVATYPNPDGEDTVVRVGYNVLQNDPIVEKQKISVKTKEDAEPVTKSDLKKIVENIMGDWIPKGVNPNVIITDENGKQITEIDRSKPGDYKVTLTYIDDNGVVKQVELDYKVDSNQDEDVIEDLRKPISDEGPMTKDDIFDDIMERYSPGIIPADITDYEITIDGPNGPVDAIDPSIPGTYTVTMRYTDEFGNEHIVKTTYTFFDPNEGMDKQAAGTDPSNGEDNGGMAKQAAGTDPSNGSDFNSGTSGSKGWDNANGQKGFADRLLAQTGDPVFWVICGVVVVAVAAGIVLIVARKKNNKQQ